MATKKTVKSVLKATVKTMGKQAKQSITNYSNLGKSIVNIGKSVGIKSQGASALQAKVIPGSLQKAKTNTAYKIGMQQNLANAQQKLAQNKLVKNRMIQGGMTGLIGTLGMQQGNKIQNAMSKLGKSSRGGVVNNSSIQTDGGLDPRMTDTGITTDSNTRSRYSGVGNVMGSTNASGNSGLTSNIINAPNVLNPNSTQLTFPEVPTTPVPTITAPVIPPPEQTNTQTALEEYLASLGDVPNNADAYNKAQKQSGILQAQQTVNNLTGQLNQIVNQGQANQLNVVGQGRGIPEAILGGQQAQFARETAIAALPIQAQLSAAQGNLEMAQDNLDTLFKIYSEDARNEYETRKEQKKMVYDIATAKEKRALEVADKLEERAYQEKQADYQTAQKYAGIALANNQSTLAGKIMKLDYKSPTFKAELANLTSQIYDPAKDLELQIKEEQLAQLKDPSGKPATQAQYTASGFASRVVQAKEVIDENSTKIMKLAPWDYAFQRKLPNMLQGPAIQKQLQAERNFVNAVLRRESGAAISPTEFESAEKQYFPMPGDTKEVLAQKKLNRDLTSANLINESGTAYQIQKTPSSFWSKVDNVSTQANYGSYPTN